MKKILNITLLIVGIFMLSLQTYAQADRHEVRVGNRKFKKENFKEADIAYRKALVKDSMSLAASYNLANNLYRQGNFKEAETYMQKIKKTISDSKYAENVYYNSGNIAAAQKNWSAAVNEYKAALLRNPEDMDAKENYTYAKLMLDNQKKQEQKNKDNKDKNKDNKDNKDKNNNKDNKNNKGNNGGQDQNQPQGGQNNISSQQAMQILKAVLAKEKETQDKVKAEKVAAMRSRKREKNW
jgi:hypothetical protein